MLSTEKTRLLRPSGAPTRLSLISCIMNNRGAAAGRSGLGAVMGSKKLKAIAVRGSRATPIADQEGADRLYKELMADLRVVRNMLRPFRKYGTASHAAESAHNGDSPVKNWGGIGIVDFPDASGLEGDAVIANLWKSDACWRCPLSCRGLLNEGTGSYKYPKGTARPEYETLASFGTMCLNNDTESIAMVNHLCNDYGLDTISAGTTIAFAIECYENGLITKEDTDGIELTWGNHQAIVTMTEKMAKRQGFGDILADGVKVAAAKIGRDAETIRYPHRRPGAGHARPQAGYTDVGTRRRSFPDGRHPWSPYPEIRTQWLPHACNQRGGSLHLLRHVDLRQEARRWNEGSHRLGPVDGRTVEGW
jgi:aldehyde:ferredoxin oxidoreductase